MRMNCAPANVAMTVRSLNSLRNWTSGASSDPCAADATMQGLVISMVVVVVVVVVRIEVPVEVAGTVEVWIVVIVTVGENVVVVMNDVLASVTVSVG